MLVMLKSFGSKPALVQRVVGYEAEIEEWYSCGRKLSSGE